MSAPKRDTSRVWIELTRGDAHGLVALLSDYQTEVQSYVESTTPPHSPEDYRVIQRGNRLIRKAKALAHTIEVAIERSDAE